MSSRVSLCVVLALTAASACQAIAGIKQKRYVGDSGASKSASMDARVANPRKQEPPDASSMMSRTDDEDGSVAVSPLCQDYCNQVTERCTDDYAVYAGVDECLPVCANLTPGTAKDLNDNTVGCRLNAAHSIVEQSDCAVAGPGGAGTCGDNCESYCQIVSKACADPAYRDFWLGDVDLCVSKCRALRDRDHDPENSATDSRYSALSTDSRDHDGDTVQCRLFHASAASPPLGPATHCWHAAIAPRPNSDGELNPCLGEVGQVAPRCKDYCHLVQVACQDDLAVYDSEAQCNAVCANFDPGMLSDQGGNTLGCRSTHAYNALVGGMLASVHCGHSGTTGGAACGGDCTSYCSLLEKGCSAQFTQLGGMSACMSQCKDWIDGSFSYSIKLAKSGSSPLACRLYALTQALADTKVAATQCPIAIGKGGC